jgi:hypothetical protein
METAGAEQTSEIEWEGFYDDESAMDEKTN